MELFTRGYLSEYTQQRVRQKLAEMERISEDELLHRSTDDIVREFVERAHLEPLVISAEPIDGGVTEGTEVAANSFGWSDQIVHRPVFKIHAVYEFSGSPELLYYKPSTSLAFIRIQADVDTRRRTLTVESVISAQANVNEAEARRSFESEIERIRKNADYASKDIVSYNASLESRIRPAVERRQQQLLNRRNLAGALGFPLTKRTEAPKPVPLTRKRIGTQRASLPKKQSMYQDEPALSEGQYEDAIEVVKSTLLAMERSPSVVENKDEEGIRDIILVQLNGTFKGNATGETFIKSGKTDLLIRVDDRHVFVGECKWWKGEKAFGKAIDQLLSYLPWRDEKAALIVFIKQKDASGVIEKAENAMRSHSSFKRVGTTTGDPQMRRNFVLGHPDDPDREIKVAVLFAVFSAIGDQGQ